MYIYKETVSDDILGDFYFAVYKAPDGRKWLTVLDRKYELCRECPFELRRCALPGDRFSPRTITTRLKLSTLVSDIHIMSVKRNGGQWSIWFHDNAWEECQLDLIQRINTAVKGAVAAINS